MSMAIYKLYIYKSRIFYRQLFAAKIMNKCCWKVLRKNENKWSYLTKCIVLKQILYQS